MTSSDELASLENERAQAAEPKEPLNAIVFIHGIFSGHETFLPMWDQLSEEQALRERHVEFYYFDYDFYRSLQDNSVRFALALRQRFDDVDGIVIVAHSMGGLVSRLALLSEKLPFVRLLLLLGTPNSGAIRLSQLGLLSQLAHAGIGGLFALFPRASGIFELSRAAAILEKSADNSANTTHVSYVSIPGLLFRADQAFAEDIKAWSSIAFATLARGTELVSALNPMAAVRITRPHDGIVEESSNNMIKAPEGRWHEKMASTTRQRGGRSPTYAHVTARACGKLNHMQLHKHRVVIELVGTIATAAFDDGVGGSSADLLSCVERWEKDLQDRDNVRVAFD